jgi:C-terminal processing protease CtpA/Prc
MRAKLVFIAFLSLRLISATHAEERFGGIGIQAGLKHNALMVIHVIPDSPASKAGLSEGLIIQKIDGSATAGKSLAECVESMRGKVGTKVKLEVVDTPLSKTNNVVLASNG